MAGLQTVMTLFSSKAPNLGLWVLWRDVAKPQRVSHGWQPPKLLLLRTPSAILLKTMLNSKSECFVTGAIPLMASPSGWFQAPLNTGAHAC